MTNLFDAFIEYGRADSLAFATELRARLLEQGLKVWFDRNDIPLGVDFQKALDEGIEKAHNYLYIIAPASVNSPYSLKCLELAIKLNKRVIPLLHVEQITQEAWLNVAKQRTEHSPLPLHGEFIAESLRQLTDLSLDVFISYCRADSDFAQKLNEELQLQGKTTWFDQENLASDSDFQQEIKPGIESSDNFLFIVSPSSVNSPN